MALITDRIDWKLDANGVLIIPPVWVSGLEAVVQRMRIRIRMTRGEWFLDREFGVPYFDNDVVPESQALLGQRYDEIKARAAIRDAILDTDDIVSVQRMELAFNNSTRALSVTFEVVTAFGDTITDTLEDL